MSIPVYSQEKLDGLEQAIASSNSIAYTSQIDIVGPSTKRPSLELVMAARKDQFDLYPLDTILATVGWNKNTDVFDRSEVYNARHSAEDKPFNMEHDPRIIIGHITGSCLVTEDYTEIAEATAFDDLPVKFHVLANSVIYRHLKSRDADLEKTVAQLIEEIKAGDWFVSMEALFSNFNYAVLDAEGTQTVIARSDETSFLTKHLRAYGGTGTYDGKQIGRMMVGLTFSGKGLVKKPANPESITLAKHNLNLFTFSGSIKTEGTENMATEINVTDLQNQIKALEARLKAMDEEKVQASLNELKATIASKDTVVADKDKALTAANTELAASKTALEASQAEVKSLQTKAEEAVKAAELVQAELAKIKEDAKQAARASSLVTKGVEADKAAELVSKFATLADDQFELIVTLAADALKKSDALPGGVPSPKGNLTGNAPAPGSVSCDAKDGDTSNDKGVKGKKADKKDGASETAAASATAASAADAVAGATESTEASLTTTDDADETANKELTSAVASYLARSRGVDTEKK